MAMIGKAILFAAAALASLGPAQLVHAQSRIVVPPVDGYFVAYEAANTSQGIREAIPGGETLESWSRMITTQWFYENAATPMEFATWMHNSVSANCTTTSMSEPNELTHQGLPAASFSATCRRPPERGGVETFYLMAVRAPDGLLVVQMAFKSEATRENVRMAVDLLRSAVICDEDCPASD
jgi:hypothetical protein